MRLPAYGEVVRVRRPRGFRSVRELGRTCRNMLVFGALPTLSGVWFVGRGRLFVDPNDSRGRRIRRRAGISSSRNMVLWRQIVRSASWQIVLDIGTNHGEIVLSTRYSGDARIHLFEPNPYLTPYLIGSIAAHRDGARMQLHRCVVSDKEGSVRFTIDRKWSGTSSALGQLYDPDGLFKGSGAEIFEEVDLPTLPIDAIFDNAEIDSLLFKIDVEGYEFRVLRGMERTLARASRFIGMIEVDADRLAAAGEPAFELISFLNRLGVVARIGKAGRPEIIDRSWRPPQSFHADLLFASDPRLLRALRLPYLIRGP